MGGIYRMRWHAKLFQKWNEGSPAAFFEPEKSILFDRFANSQKLLTFPPSSVLRVVDMKGSDFDSHALV